MNMMNLADCMKLMIIYLFLPSETLHISLGWASEQKNLCSTMDLLSFLILNSKLYPVISEN